MLALLLSGMVVLGGVPATASAAIYSHNVAYVFDDAQFPCGASGCGMNDASGPGRGASIFVNALTGSAPGSGDTGTYTPATDTLGAVNLTNVPFSTLNSNPHGLSGFDTAIVYETCNIGTAANANALGALNAFVNGGGKLMIFDADACAASAQGPADWSNFVFPFATNSPGPQGASGTYDAVVPSPLTAGLFVGDQPGDAVGDANVFTTYNGNWSKAIVATNLNTSGFVEAYANTPSQGLAIYSGEDFWYTDGPTSHLQLVFDNMLGQPWDPSGLPTSSASGISLAPTTASVVAGQSVALTTTAADAVGNPQAGVVVTLHVGSGPDAGVAVSGVTDSNGQYVFSFTASNVGTDSLIASYVDSGGQTHTSNSVSVIVLPRPDLPKAAVSPRRAVVFVSGLDSSQAFSDPRSFASGCASGTWGAEASSVASSLGGRYQVFDAPMDAGAAATADCPGTQATPPSKLHLNTRDFADQAEDGTRLLRFLAWLHTSHGVDNVWLVGHSYGGIWSRSALTQLAAQRKPAVHIDGIITVGTPHTGSFGADAYSAAASSCTFAFASNAYALACDAAAAVRLFAGNAINGLTHNSLTAWNASQTQQTSWGCVPIATIAGTRFHLPYLGGLGPVSYVVPNDLIVGLQSAAGNGPGSSITRLMPPLKADMIHVWWPLDPFATVETSARAELVTKTILSTVTVPVPYEANCPRLASGKARIASTAAGAVRPHSHVVTLTGLAGLNASRSRLPRVAAGTILLADGSTTVRCGVKPVPSLPLLGLQRFRLLFAPRCRQPLKAAFGKGPHRLAALVRSRAVANVTVLGHGRFTVARHALASNARVTLVLSRPEKRLMLRIGRSRYARIQVKPGKYQLQIVARMGAAPPLVGTIPLRIP